MKINTREQYLDMFKNKRIAILVFNKDSRNFLRFSNSNLRVTNFRIEYLIDLSFDYRENLKKLAKEVFDEKRIVTNIFDLENIIENNLVDMIVCFDLGFDRSYIPQYIHFNRKNIKSLKDCYDVLHDDYLEYQKLSSKAEFNFRWSMDVIDFINILAAKKGIYITNAYWGKISPNRSLLSENKLSNEYFVSINGINFLKLLPFIEKGFEDAKLRLVLGSDWACGKASFLLNRMKNGKFGIAGDLWFSLFSDIFLPELFIQDLFIVKGVIANQVYKAWKKNPDNEIFIKLEGIIEEYVYGFPQDRRHMIENFHNFFKNIKFILLIKPSQNISDIQDSYNAFKSLYEIKNNIEVYRMHYDGKEERIIL